MEEPAQYVDFMVKYKDWISIRRQSFDENTKPEEIAYVLSVIRQSIDKRYYAMLGIDTAKLDQYASKITAGMKGYAGLSKVAEVLDSKEAKEIAAIACKDRNLKKIAESYLVSRAADKMGVKTYLDSDELMKIYPDLKIYKPKKPRGTGKGAED